MHIYIYMHIYICIYIYMYICIYIWYIISYSMCPYIYIYMHMYIYIYIPIDSPMYFPFKVHLNVTKKSRYGGDTARAVSLSAQAPCCGPRGLPNSGGVMLATLLATFYRIFFGIYWDVCVCMYIYIQLCN